MQKASLDSGSTMTNDVLRAALMARQKKDGSAAGGSPAKSASLSASSRMAQAAAQQQLPLVDRIRSLFIRGSFH